MRGFGASLLCTALAAAFPSSGAALQTSAVDRTALPKPAGPHSVGVRRFAWTDTSRLEWDTLSGIKQRRLLVRVWYPAQRGPSSSAAYLPQREAYEAAGIIGSNT